eukprot:5662991-Pleurochrysis_carterae.AAC.1
MSHQRVQGGLWNHSARGRIIARGTRSCSNERVDCSPTLSTSNSAQDGFLIATAFLCLLHISHGIFIVDYVALSPLALSFPRLSF